MFENDAVSEYFTFDNLFEEMNTLRLIKLKNN